MIKVRLREAMAAYKERTGERIKYETLALKTGLNIGTIQAIGSRDSYNTRLSTIDKLCEALECEVSDLLERVPNDTGEE